MTVQTETSISGPYAGAGTTGPFTVGFRFLSAAHLQVIRTSAAGVNTTLTLTTDYTVAGAGGASGTVTLVAALPVGESLTIARDVPFTQLADYVNNDAFPAESHEDALDLLTMQTQQIKGIGDRSLSLPVTVTGVSTELPNPAAANLIGWNSNATALQNYDAGSLGVSIAYAAWATQTFNGTGAQTAFVLTTDAGNASNCDVSVGGVTQVAEVNYTYTAATKTITFLTGAPPVGVNNVSVRYGQALALGAVASASITDSTVTGRALITAASAAAARTAMGAAASGANSDITSLSGLTTALSIAQGGTGETNQSAIVIVKAAMPTTGTYTAGSIVLELTTSNRLSGWKRLTTGSGHVLNTDWSYFSGLPINSGTVVATTSGTSIDFTGIPAGVKRLTVMLSDVSTNGISPFMLQIGDSGGLENSGYLGGVGNTGGGTALNSTFYQLSTAPTAASTFDGTFTLMLLNAAANLWTIQGSGYLTGVTMCIVGGSKPLSATLDRLRLSTAGGADTFDRGSMNILWEF